MYAKRKKKIVLKPDSKNKILEIWKKVRFIRKKGDNNGSK